ncbi:MAG: hypothetical protein ABEJ36_03150 [Candidatus Nanosalina sp.]
MDNQDIVLTVVIASLVTGIFMSPQVDAGKVWQNLQSDLEKFTAGSQEHRKVRDPKNYSFKLGSDHDHAQFYVNLNGSEYNFSKKKFQVRSYYVHMENYRPHIVHKHSENVTWRFFLQTMDIALNHSKNLTCISVMGNRTCGDGSVVLNGEHTFSLDREIKQGDNLAIIIPESENLTRRYMNKKLPEAYTPDTGTKV